MTQGILRTKNYLQFQIHARETNEVLVTFEGAKYADKALPSDIVEWNGTSCRLIERAKHYPITGVIELTSKTKYGITSRGIPIYLFIPLRKDYPPMIVGCSQKDVSKNQLALVDFDTWTSSLPRANLRKLLGPVGNVDVEKQSILLNYNPFTPPKSLLVTTDAPPQINYTGRLQTPEQTFNIDPKGCKDIDDVLSIQTTEAGVELWITIADVAEVVKDDSPLDSFAKLQGLTAYEDGRAAIPMLPHLYSENYCSLLQNQERPGVSLILLLDPLQGYTITSSRWCLSRVLNRMQFDYDTFTESSSKLNINLDILSRVAEQVLGYTTDDPHKWVEACMLKYNIEAANILRKVGKGILRKHAPPDMEALEKYSAFGDVNLEILANSSATYCNADDIEPHHYGLQTNLYSHASSPIRRYADLFNQRVLKAHILGFSTQFKDARESCIWLNQRQKDNKHYERDLFFLNQITISKVNTVECIILRIDEVSESTARTTREFSNCKIKLWIPEWKITYTWKSTQEIPEELQPGAKIVVDYFANPTIRNWKEKIVFRFNRTL